MTDPSFPRLRLTVRRGHLPHTSPVLLFIAYGIVGEKTISPNFQFFLNIPASFLQFTFENFLITMIEMIERHQSIIEEADRGVK